MQYLIGTGVSYDVAVWKQTFLDKNSLFYVEDSDRSTTIGDFSEKDKYNTSFDLIPKRTYLGASY